MTTDRSIRMRKTAWLVGTLMLVSLALLIILQSTNLWKTFSIETSADLLLLYALSSLNFIAFVIFGFIFLRSIIRLARERRTLELGAQIKTRLLMYFFAVSLLPIVAMAVFSYLFLNRALDRWFSQIPDKVVQQAREMQQSAIQDRAAKLEQATRMIAASLEGRQVNDADLERLADAGHLTYAAILDGSDRLLAVHEQPIAPENLQEFASLLRIARSGDMKSPSLSDGLGFDVGSAPMSNGRRLVIVPDPVSENAIGQVVDTSLSELQILRQEQVNIRRIGLLTLGVLTFLLIFASSWIAFYIARGLTTPIKALAEGAGEIAMGNLSYRVNVFAEDELAILVSAFNEMAAQLDASSSALAERRRYIETLLETLPTGVLSVDANDSVATINKAAQQILGIAETSDGTDQIINGEPFRRLIHRARRVGTASDQTQIPAETGNERTVAITASALPSDGAVVVVIEDLSELIAAQRASAWQEVARRMAHEIKNPLTPIQLSAERISRRFRRAGHSDQGAGKRINDKGPISDVVHESTETILREVSSLKTMVDEFSRFARLPDANLAPGDLKEIIYQAVATFDGQYPEVEISFVDNGVLPEVLLDPEQMKRVYVNLIANAVEAMEGLRHPHQQVTITARHDTAREMIISEVIDNGPGVSQSDLQKLFQPYFSTKERGTGLGLAIVKRIISDHHGKINVVTSHPTGAKFIIELPVT